MNLGFSITNNVCNTLQYTATHFNITATQCNDLATRGMEGERTLNFQSQTMYAAHCNTLQHIATHCNTLQHTATHCNIQQYTATHCNILQYTAIHCNSTAREKERTLDFQSRTMHATHYTTLQHTATHCNALQQRRGEEREPWLSNHERCMTERTFVYRCN